MEDNIICEKSFAFSLKAIELYKMLSNKREYVLSRQFLRSATSIGANVEEATAAQTRRDFATKMAIASKEARETKYWLRLLDKSQVVQFDYSTYLLDINEIIRILTAIVKTAQTNIKRSN